jgi:signal transduction histidine kinase
MITPRTEERVLAGWAHDLGKPLQVIGRQARRLVNEVGQDQRARELARTIVALSDDALRVVDRLMESARPKEPGVVRPDELRTIVERVVSAIRRLHPGCAFRVRGSVPAVEIDQPGQLSSALINFADNAIRSSEHRQAVTILARLDGDDLVIDVIDQGKGMPPSIQERAFEPYFSTRRNSGPTGLGLPECRAQIESMGGYVELESVDGNGTRASVILPNARTRAPSDAHCA